MAGLAIFLVSVVVLTVEAGSSPFEADEADYVATSRYFGYLFLQRDVARAEWDDNHWTRTQPPLTRYIVGAWLTLYGYDLDKMNQPYVSTASSYEVNVMKGRVPTAEVLARARQPMVLLGAAAVTLLYPLGLLLAGPPAGLAAVGLTLTSPFVRYTLVHVWAEAPLACCLLLAALFACVGVWRLATGAGWWTWGLGLGLALGLASATKLTGLVGIPIVVAVAAVLATRAWRRGIVTLPGSYVAWAMTATGAALAVFVLVNPYLWRGPVEGLIGMLEERRDEMAFQQEQWPEFAVQTIGERPWLMAVGMTRVGPWGDVPLVAVPVGLGLAAIGLISMARRCHDVGMGSPSQMFLAWLGGYVIVIFVGLGLSYPRYFMPACLLLLPLMGVGVSALVALVWPAAASGGPGTLSDQPPSSKGDLAVLTTSPERAGGRPTES